MRSVWKLSNNEQPPPGPRHDGRFNTRSLFYGVDIFAERTIECKNEITALVCKNLAD
ncbi:MAG: hypothetical protein IMY85_10940 [Chloroflexi bacterium]|nr:hypothetical protein [Chloroflexota bacterium]